VRAVDLERGDRQIGAAEERHVDDSASLQRVLDVRAEHLDRHRLPRLVFAALLCAAADEARRGSAFLPRAHRLDDDELCGVVQDGLGCAGERRAVVEMTGLA
jgi:hypothetical protein